MQANGRKEKTIANKNTISQKANSEGNHNRHIE